MAFNIEKADVIWKWNEVYRGLGAQAESFKRYFVEDLRNSNLPATRVDITQLKVGLIFGGRREYLEISADHLGAWRIFVGARTYGTHLSISMFLVTTGGRNRYFNTFEWQDLLDYLSSTQLTLEKALKSVAADVGMDPKELKLEFKDVSGAEK